MNNGKTKVISLRIKPNVYNALESYIKKRGVSKQDYLETRLSDHFELLLSVYKSIQRQESQDD